MHLCNRSGAKHLLTQEKSKYGGIAHPKNTIHGIKIISSDRVLPQGDKKTVKQPSNIPFARNRLDSEKKQQLLAHPQLSFVRCPFLLKKGKGRFHFVHRKNCFLPLTHKNQRSKPAYYEKERGGSHGHLKSQIDFIC